MTERYWCNQFCQFELVEWLLQAFLAQDISKQEIERVRAWQNPSNEYLHLHDQKHHTVVQNLPLCSILGSIARLSTLPGDLLIGWIVYRSSRYIDILLLTLSKSPKLWEVVNKL